MIFVCEMIILLVFYYLYDIIIIPMAMMICGFFGHNAYRTSHKIGSHGQRAYTV